MRKRRKELIALSKNAKQMVKSGMASRVNEALKMIYFPDTYDQVELNTLKNWNKEGFKVKEGESSHSFWGKPITKEVKKIDDDGNVEKVEEETSYFPVACLFTRKQVEKEETND